MPDLLADLELCGNVFVYGTLKQGYGNNLLLKGATFLGPAVSVNSEFSMTNVGFPYLILSGNSFVRGELYRIGLSAIVLQRTDRLEGYPHHYDRQIKQFVDDNGTKHQAWVYCVNPSYNQSGTPVEPDENNILTWS